MVSTLSRLNIKYFETIIIRQITISIIYPNVKLFIIHEQISGLYETIDAKISILNSLLFTIN